ncbi:MAG: hypothetical protein U9N35_03225 [Euryarchaeota archaeon]|nr:hypothetical protein [Euryarchaeota archaeon]
MAKTKSEILLGEIADDFVQYLMSGDIDLTPFTQEIDPDLQIDDMEKLLRIHFVLTGGENKTVGVIDFVKKLSERLRRVKTTVKKEKEILNSEVRGRIDWKATITQRYRKNPNDKTSFVCDRQEKNYNVDENLVLKQLLQIIHEIIYKDLKVAVEREYSWLKGWLKEKKLRRILKELFLRNVYLKRVSLSNVRVTNRMISRTLKSRSPLYREAAQLLRQYRQLMDYEIDADEAKELLRNTFINPKREEVLFELYWIIKIIKDYFESPTFHLIEPGNNIVAELESEGYKYKIYHDSCGACEFKENIRDLGKRLRNKDNYLGRELKVIEELERMAGKHLHDSLWGGRPDIILEKYDENDKIVSVLIGEVKYTDNKNYAIQGLRELLEYIALIREGETYKVHYEDLFENIDAVRGCLFLDEIADWNVEGKENIPIVMFGEDSNKLKDVMGGIKRDSH